MTGNKAVEGAMRRLGQVVVEQEERITELEALAKESLRLLELPMMLIAEEDDNADAHIEALKAALRTPSAEGLSEGGGE
jgi:hypothetical protein